MWFATDGWTWATMLSVVWQIVLPQLSSFTRDLNMTLPSVQCNLIDNHFPFIQYSLYSCQSCFDFLMVLVFLDNKPNWPERTCRLVALFLSRILFCGKWMQSLFYNFTSYFWRPICTNTQIQCLMLYSKTWRLLIAFTWFLAILDACDLVPCARFKAWKMTLVIEEAEASRN